MSYTLTPEEKLIFVEKMREIQDAKLASGNFEEWEVPNYAEPVFGQQQEGPVKLIVHARKKCEGQTCPIHNPTEHPLSKAPFNWRADTGVMKRICRHGVGHPDPDNEEFYIKTKQEWKMSHGCDGCCMGTTFN